MQGKLELFKLPLTPENTLYFESKEEQTAWFNSKVERVIDNVSFNGSRPFRLSFNYLDAIFDYNYCHFKLQTVNNEKDFYAFINGFNYVNDTTCDIDIQIDLTQTFLEEIKKGVTSAFVSNATLKTEEFTKYVPFNNKVTPQDYSVVNLYKNTFSKEYTVAYPGTAHKIYCGFIVINCKKGNSFSADGVDALINNGIYTNVETYLIPIQYDNTTHSFYGGVFTLNTFGGINGDETVGHLMGLEEFLEFNSAYIIDIGITFDKFRTGMYFDDNNSDIIWLRSRSAIGSPETDYINNIGYNRHSYTGKGNTIHTSYYLYVKYTTQFIEQEIDLSTYINNIPLALQRHPYTYIRIGNDIDYILLNLLDFYNKEQTTVNNKLKLYIYTSLIYPFTQTLRFTYNGKQIEDVHKYFTLVSSDPIPYDVSAWASYYANHQASVNDGLATQQRYERYSTWLNAGVSLTNSAIQTGFDIASLGATKYAFRIGNKTPTMQDWANVKGRQYQITGNIITDTISTAGNISDMYINQAKERALLEIQFNDIKSSPSEYSNTASTIYNRYSKSLQCISVDLYIARNIEDIKMFHKQFGYAINKVITNPLQKLLKQHTLFDYISVNDVETSLSYPYNYVISIQEQLKNGIRFWYDKENFGNTFLNYEIENQEVN